jgi:hypothetical protein
VIGSSLSSLSIANRLRELFLLESYFAYHERNGAAQARIEQLQQVDNELPFTNLLEMKQMILNANPEEWTVELSQEGRLLTMVVIRLGTAFAEEIRGRAEEDLVGDDGDVRLNFEEATEAFVATRDAIKLAKKNELNNEIQNKLALKLGLRTLALLGSPVTKHYKMAGAKQHEVYKQISNLEKHCLKAHGQALNRRAQLFFLDRIRSVEILWRGELQTVHFNRPSNIKYLQHPRADFEKLQDTTSKDKLVSFTDECCASTLRSMKFSVWLDTLKLPIAGSVYDLISSFERLEALSFLVAVFNSLLMLLGLEHKDISKDAEMVWATNFRDAETVNIFLGALQVILSATTLFLQLLRQFPKLVLEPLHEFRENHAPLTGRKQRVILLHAVQCFLASLLPKVSLLFAVSACFWQRNGQIGYIYAASIAVVPIMMVEMKHYVGAQPATMTGFVFLVTYNMLLNSAMLFHWIYLVAGIYGFTRSILFLCVPLFKATTLSPTIKNVAKSVLKPIRTLALTLALAAIAIFCFSLVAFSMLSADFAWEDEDDEVVSPCRTLLSCFLYIFHKGMINQVGILFAGPLSKGLHYEGSSDALLFMLFDLSFYLLVSGKRLFLSFQI